MKSFKASELFRKTYFQIKVNKSGSVIISDLGESRGNRSSWARFYACYFHILFTSRTLQNSHVDALFSWKKIKSGRKYLVKRKKKKWKNRPQAQSPRLNSPFPNARSEKRKIPAQNDRAATNPTQNPSTYTVVSFQFTTNSIFPVPSPRRGPHWNWAWRNYLSTTGAKLQWSPRRG